MGLITTELQKKVKTLNDLRGAVEYVKEKLNGIEDYIVFLNAGEQPPDLTDLNKARVALNDADKELQRLIWEI